MEVKICTYWIGQLPEPLSVDGQQDVSLLDPATLLGRLAREKMLYPHQAAKVASGRIQLAHEEAEAQAFGTLGQRHLLCVVWVGVELEGGE